MKKIFALLLALLASTALFAASGSYVVESFVGNVTYESAPGKFEKVKNGQELTASTVINTGLNSTLTVVFEGKTYTIKAKQKGAIEELIGATATAKAGINTSRKIAKVEGTDTADGTREGVKTASSRASDAKQDYSWDEGEN